MTLANPTHAAADGFPADPRSLSLTQRAQWMARMDAAQRAWAARLPTLVEPPAPEPDFPAFLLETPAFLGLNRAIGEAASRAQLAVGVADELQHFVDAFRDYMHTLAGEETFARVP